MLAEQVKSIFENKELVHIGKIKDRPFYKEYLTEGQLNHHVHVVGASGYGKTVLLSHIIKQRIEQKKGLMFIDLKGDKDTLMKFSKLVIDADRADDLQIFSLTEKQMSLPYNFIEDGTPTQLRDRIMSSLNWSEEYYKNQSASYLLKLLIVLCWFRDNRKMIVGLSQILEGASSLGFVEKLALEIPESENQVFRAASDCRNFLKDNENYKSLQGLRTQIESLVLSDFGELITADYKGINLYETVNQGKIIF